MRSADQIAEAVEEVRRHVAAAGRDDVRIVAVTKGFGAHEIDTVHGLGIHDIGESYAQELLGKLDVVPDDVRVHFIGRIQRNKVRKIAAHVHLWHSVARPEIVDEIARRAVEPEILLQVQTPGDENKAGVAPEVIPGLLESAAAQGVTVRGLMTMGVHDDPAATRRVFRALGRLADDLGLPERSMGMSDDYRMALEEGATLLRLGRTLFGPRS